MPTWNADQYLKFADGTADFRLFETMRVAAGGVLLFERHLERLQNSAKYFSFKLDVDALRNAVARTVRATHAPAYLRVSLWEDGRSDLDSGPLPSDNPRQLRISAVRMDSTNPFLYHKTSKRGIYEEARRGCDGETEVLLVNERGEITETTITNVAVLRSGKWLTAPLSCGLLPGVTRAELLANGSIVEGVVRADELAQGELIRCFNALRGIFDVPLTLAP
jgi:para-aminobenzoate synthetase/4-amino-4-deoxychorismate lyase